MNSLNGTFGKYVKLIKSRRFTERQLISFRRYVNGSSPLNGYDAEYLISLFNTAAESGIKLTRYQQYKGRKWLLGVTFKLNGQVRKNAPLGYFEQKVVKSFAKFRCVGLYNLSDNSYRQYVPVYRCIARNGSYFDYVCMMWGEIKIVSIGDRNGSISHSNQPEWELARNGTQSLRLVA